MGEVKQAIEALQASNPLVIYHNPDTVQPSYYGSLVDHNEPPDNTIESKIDQSSSLSSLLVDQNLEIMPEGQVDLGESLEVAESLGEPLVDQRVVSLEQVNDSSSLLVVHSDSMAVVEDAIAMPLDDLASKAGEEEVGEPVIEQTGEEREVVEEITAAPQYLTRVQLSYQFGISRQAISKWSVDRFAEKGWELVPGTGGRKNLPRYRPITQTI